MRDLYRRRQDGKFPVYKPEAERGNYYTVEREENGRTVFDRVSYSYDKVEDISDMSINFDTHKHGAFGEPFMRDGRWLVEREVLSRDMEAVNNAYWSDVRAQRDAELARTDVLVLRALEENLVGHDDLKEHRRKLRNITNPQLNGGKKDPKSIKVKKF